MMLHKWLFRSFGILIAVAVSAADAQSADEIIASVNARDEGITQIREANLTLRDKSGKTRDQVIRVYRKYYDDEKRTVIFYLEPANVKDTGFLTFDYPEADKDDDQWLYLPAMRKVRRISASNKGDYFLGTDLTYDDLKRDAKVSAHEYTWTAKGTETVAGKECHVVEGIPKTDDIAEELGYGKAVIYVDPASNMILQYDYWDMNGNSLKRIENQNIEQIDGIWTSNRIEVTNHKTGHGSILEFTSTTYSEPIDDGLFSDRALLRGAPR